VIGVEGAEEEGAEESGSALTSCLIFFFTSFPFFTGAFRTGVGVGRGLGERTGGCSGYQQRHNWTSFFVPTVFSS
jgi:hypothetical protein